MMWKTLPPKIVSLGIAVLASFSPAAIAEVLNGSSADPANGPDLDVAANSTVVIDLGDPQDAHIHANDIPSAGVLNYRNITIHAGGTLKFRKNALNTPVALLATGPITIDGTIDVSAGSADLVNGTPDGTRGGPGGFDGGTGGFDAIPPGPGHGPGGGRGGDASYGGAGRAGVGVFGPGGDIRFPGQPPNGVPYGSALLVPMCGGSGGGGLAGNPGVNGGGGGGGILIASDDSIALNGSIKARGGSGFSTCSSTDAAGDSYGGGGGVRLVAPAVTGSGSIDVRGGTLNELNTNCHNQGGPGRIRVDAVDRTDLSVANFTNNVTQGKYLVAFPVPVSEMPRIEIVSVGGQAVPHGAVYTVPPFPFGDTDPKVVVIHVQNFGAPAHVSLRVEPASGDAQVLGPLLVADNANEQFTVPFPVNTPARVIVYGTP